MTDHFFGINLNKISEMGQIKLANALRKFLAFGKKLVVIAFKRMSNGALWLCYTVDRIRCSTFIGADNLHQLLISTHPFSAGVSYIEAVAIAFFKIDINAYTDYGMGSVKVKVKNPTKPHANNTYDISYSDQHNAWIACLPRSGNEVLKSDTVKALLSAIVVACK
jgi:hypothetical protein